MNNFSLIGGAVGGAVTSNKQELFISLMLKKVLASPPGLETGTKP